MHIEKIKKNSIVVPVNGSTDVAAERERSFVDHVCREFLNGSVDDIQVRSVKLGETLYQRIDA